MQNLTLLEVIKSSNDSVKTSTQFLTVIKPQSSHLTFYTQSEGYVTVENINHETCVFKTKKGAVVELPRT